MRIAMGLVKRLYGLRLQLLDGWGRRAVSLKAISFALVGVVNTLVDYSVFLLAREALSGSAVAVSLFVSVSIACHCTSPTTVSLIAANLTSWLVATTGSYIMNSSITFAAESGRKLRWRSYSIFVGSGVAGWVANTAALVFAAQILLLPVWAAKAVAILASFCVNFSLSHFVVFRVRREPVLNVREDV
jgi:putative flippase GtrA